MKPTFYKKSCAVPGHKEKIISFLDDDNPIPVYDDVFYRSEAWDSLAFAVSYSPELPVLNQLSNFFKTVPHQTLHKDPKSINSEYVVSGDQAVNCYYVATPVLSENLQYGSVSVKSKDSIDFADLDESEQCYGCTRSARAYNCAYCVGCADSVDSSFLYDCRNCMSCYMSSNLRNAKYIWQNQQLSKEEYEKRLAEIDLGSYLVNTEQRTQYESLLRTAIHKNLDLKKTENCIGNVIDSCRNAYDAFRSLENCENVRHAILMRVTTDSMDMFGGARSSLVYEGAGVVEGAQIKFSSLIRTGREVEYCTECSNVEFCFGCIGLRGKKFCIFNKQYSEDDYWRMVDEIKFAMLERGEYGEFFPISDSPFPYNDSNAQFEFPLMREDVLANGWKWHDDKESAVDLAGMSVVQAADLPDHIREVGDDILSKAIICAESGRPFRLTPYELAFYRKHNLPLPRLHPDVRIKKLLKHRIPCRLFDDTCKKCGKAMKSGYDPAKGYNVWCEECYKNEIA